MTKKITEVRETIGKDSKGIVICGIEGIQVLEGKKELKARGVKNTGRNSDYMVIPVYNGNNPNRQEDLAI